MATGFILFATLCVLISLGRIGWTSRWLYKTYGDIEDARTYDVCIATAVMTVVFCGFLIWCANS